MYQIKQVRYKSRIKEQICWNYNIQKKPKIWFMLTKVI